jgi:hypothetical protein
VDNVYFSQPSSSFGYYRGNPLAFGQGSGQGVDMAGANVFSAGSGPTSDSGTSWSPTILYLFVLIVVEMFVFGFLARRLG